MKRLDGTITLSLLDEDNSQRMIFRIFPLCTKDGLIFGNRKQSYPDFGSLRIIPDKREQSSFKERMREMGSLCCVQLSSDGKELTKVRQNRNYDPNQGECNQYAIYSDVICGFEPSSVFEVFQENQPISSALTENVLLQRGKVLYGPIQKDAAVDWDELKPFGNEQFLLHTVEDSDGNQRSFYWNPEAIVTWRQRKREQKRSNTLKQDKPAVLEPAAPLPVQEPIPQPAPEIKAEVASDSIPIGTKLEILDDDLTTIEQISELNKPVSVSANRLVDTPVPVVNDQPKEAPKFHGTPISESPKNGKPSHNGHGVVHGVVEKQINQKQQQSDAARSDRRMVENPIENLRIALQHAWSIPSLHQQALGILGDNQELIDSMMASKFMDRQTQTAYSAAKAELDEIEGERIALLVELDKVKNNYQQIKEKMYTELAKQKQKELETLSSRLEELTAQQKAAEETLSQLGDSIQTGTLKLLKAKAAMDIQSNGADLILSPTMGVSVETYEIVETVWNTMSAMGFKCKHDCVTEFMVFLSTHEEICVAGDTIAEAELYVKNVLRALGLLNVTAWTDGNQNLRIVSLLPETDQRTPTFEIIKDGRAAIHAYGHKTIRLLDQNHMEPAGSLPVARVPEYNRNRELERMNETGRPVSLHSIHAFANRADLLYKDGEEWLISLRNRLLSQNIEIPDDISMAAYTFVRAATPQLNGGLMEAVDTAALAWIVPKLAALQFPPELTEALIGNMPKCMHVMAKLNR